MDLTIAKKHYLFDEIISSLEATLTRQRQAFAATPAFNDNVPATGWQPEQDTNELGRRGVL
jgi:hypothetical protein